VENEDEIYDSLKLRRKASWGRLVDQGAGMGSDEEKAQDILRCAHPDGDDQT
jgi:hypothetical protein